MKDREFDSYPYAIDRKLVFSHFATYLCTNLTKRAFYYAKKVNKRAIVCFFHSLSVTLEKLNCLRRELKKVLTQQASTMRIQFEIRENLPEIIEEIMNSPKWQTSVKEEISGRTTVVIRDQAYDSEATVEIYAKEIDIRTAWSKYYYRIFIINDVVWCEYNGAYRGLLEQILLPTITPRESLLESEVTESSLYGNERKTLRKYAEDNLKLKQFRRENFNENMNGTAPFDHPKRVYDEFIKEDYVVIPKNEKK